MQWFWWKQNNSWVFSYYQGIIHLYCELNSLERCPFHGFIHRQHSDDILSPYCPIRSLQSLQKGIDFLTFLFSSSFHLLQIAPHCDGSQHIFLGEWERESGALMEFAHFQNILSSDNFPFESFWLIYKSASLMWTGSPFQYQLINWIFCSDTLWWWCVFFLFQLLYFQRVRRQCCLVWCWEQQQLWWL